MRAVLSAAALHPVYASLGLGPLYAAFIAARGLLGPSGPWLSETERWLEWLVLIVLADVLGWTLTNLSVAYEDFWRLPGWAHAIRRLGSADAPGGRVRALADESRAALGETLTLRRLASHGLDRARLSRPYRLYAYARGAWLAAALAVLMVAIELVREAIAGAGGLGDTAIALGAAAAAAVVAAVASVALGRALAGRVARDLRELADGAAR